MFEASDNADFVMEQRFTKHFRIPATRRLAWLALGGLGGLGALSVKALVATAQKPEA
jgi:hypothetical protein